MKNGFSLVELSIVLVILGLLTGGILAGQNLIRAAELRAIPTEFSAYQSAALIFRDQYLALPGDMRNATDFWGEMINCNVAGTSGVGTQICNGDGDGIIEYSNVSAPLQNGETFMFWKHLVNAGLISGEYTVLSGPGNHWHAIVGENIPKSRMDNAGWSISYTTVAPSVYNVDYNKAFLFGRNSFFGTSINGGAILTPEEAWNVDAKMDDGMPGTGQVIGIGESGWYQSPSASYTNRCTLSLNYTEIDKGYNIEHNGKQCALFLIRSF